MNRAPGMLLLSACLAMPAPAWTLPETARVARDVARVFNMPEGREVARLRRNDRVAIRGSVDRRRGSTGAVWVRIRAVEGHGRRGWMRAGDLRTESGDGGRAPAVAPPGAANGNGVWRVPEPTDGAWALAGDSSLDVPMAAEVPIVDMNFQCRRGDDGAHIAGCDLITAFEVPPARLGRDELIAPVRCEVSIRWTGVSGTEYRQLASGRRQVPVMARVARSSMRLHYDFREPAVNALVERQRCGLARH